MLRNQLEDIYNESIEKNAKKLKIREAKEQKMLVDKIWNDGIDNLKKNIKKGELKYISSYRNFNSSCSYKEVFETIRNKAIKNGITFYPYISDNYYEFYFGICNYSYNYMLEEYESLINSKCWEYYFDFYEKKDKILDLFFSFILNESIYYKEIQESGELPEIDEKNISQSYYVAMYRMGYDVEVSYMKYLDTLKELNQTGIEDELGRKINVLCEKVINCIEISHIVNKQKLKEKNKFKIRKR